jgi:hypothetical protein
MQLLDAPTATPTASPSKSDDNNNDNKSNDAQETSSTGRAKVITTNLNTGGMTITATGTTGTGRATGNSTSTRTRPPHKTFNEQDPAGGVSMITPAITAGYQLYKIGDYVTWAWNYTSLQAKPTAIDVYVKYQSVAQPWTLTQNMSFAWPQSYTWDTGAYQSSHVANPLLTEEYTLVIADADGGISATPEPGYLAPFSGLIFGLYEPQEYHNNTDGYQCASCSGAMSGLDTRAVGVAVMMSTLTVLSFTWFVMGFGAFL